MNFSVTRPDQNQQQVIISLHSILRNKERERERINNYTKNRNVTKKIGKLPQIMFFFIQNILFKWFTHDLFFILVKL